MVKNSYVSITVKDYSVTISGGNCGKIVTRKHTADGRANTLTHAMLLTDILDDNDINVRMEVVC
jgi:hypothetical protein